MDLNHYFDPVDFSIYIESARIKWNHTLGATIEKNTLALNDKNRESVAIAIVGIPFESQDNEMVPSAAADLVRDELYQLAGLGKLNMVDLGNLKPAQSQKGYFLALRDVIDYLSELKIATLVIGGSEDFSYGISQAFRNDKFFSFSAIDACLDIKKTIEPYQSDNYLSRIFTSQPDVFQFNLLGFQRHFVPEETFSKLKGVGNHLSLGKLREDLSLAEPLFRNSDYVSIDFGTLKYSESHGKKMLPNGLGGEEICQLTRYAGMSNRLKVLGLFEINTQEDTGMSSMLAAQAAWYFIEGITLRNHLKPANIDGFTINKVEVWQVEAPLVFFQNNETGQWWMQLKAADQSLHYMACSEQDYLDATYNEIPEIWLKYVQKIDEILK